MSKPVLLDVYCGAGGAGRGYADAGFDVIGIDLYPQPHYPYRFIQSDALEYLDTADLGQFAAIHASPVCKGYTELNSSGKANHARQILLVRDRLERIGLPWVIENVEGAVSELPASLMLCGTMFGLRVVRHRFFESSHMLFAPGPCQHKDGCIGVYGGSVWDSSRTGTTRKDGRVRPAIVPWEIGAIAMQIDWMTHQELTQALPPAYTRWIGQFLMQIISPVEALA